MARHKKIETEEQGDPEMNISSMIDCCFLLLIYFLVATSLVSEKKLDISVPADGAPSTQKAKVDPGRILVKEDGSVWWNETMPVGPALDMSIEPGSAGYAEQRHLNDLVDQLVTIRDIARNADAEPVIMLKAHRRAKQQRIVDVMAAMAEAQIQTVGLGETDE